MRRCIKCGKSSIDDKFCTQCGMETTEERKCKHCESINMTSYILPHENFCGECGRPSK